VLTAVVAATLNTNAGSAVVAATPNINAGSVSSVAGMAVAGVAAATAETGAGAGAAAGAKGSGAATAETGAGAGAAAGTKGSGAATAGAVTGTLIGVAGVIGAGSGFGLPGRVWPSATPECVDVGASSDGCNASDVGLALWPPFCWKICLR
jgi:hypothetical protein